jgi:tripartite-type tricarboxylate transporter receptor subunit TctC
METDMKRIPARTATLAAFLLCLASAPTQAQNWPNKPVRIIAPFAPGGAADTLGRLIAEQLTVAFKQQFFVENRGGAGGIVGAAAGAAAEPDGYTLVVSSIASNVISPIFNANPGYDGLKDFTHIAYLGGPPAVVLVHPSLGVTTYKDLVALARSSKEPMSYISPGTGSNGFLVAEYLAQHDHYKISHIPYKGAGPAMTDLIAGHVKLGTITFSSATEQIRAGKVIPLAVSTEKRIPNFPDIPTLKESGQDLVAATWFALSGPAKLPNDIVQAVSRETLKAMQSPVIQQRLALDAIETKLMSPEEFTKFVEAETTRWAPLAKSLSAVVAKE